MNQGILIRECISDRASQYSNNIVVGRELSDSVIDTASKVIAWRLNLYIITPYIPNLFAHFCNHS